MNGITVKSKVHFQRWRRSKRQIQSGKEQKPLPGRVPRVAKLMALAIRFEQLVHDGVVADYAEIARLGHVSRAQVTQITNLLNLAPDIQEEILFLARIASGRDPLTERVAVHGPVREPRNCVAGALSRSRACDKNSVGQAALLSGIDKQAGPR